MISIVNLLVDIVTPSRTLSRSVDTYSTVQYVVNKGKSIPIPMTAVNMLRKSIVDKERNNIFLTKKKYLCSDWSLCSCACVRSVPWFADVPGGCCWFWMDKCTARRRDAIECRNLYKVMQTRVEMKCQNAHSYQRRLSILSAGKIWIQSDQNQKYRNLISK